MVYVIGIVAALIILFGFLCYKVLTTRKFNIGTVQRCLHMNKK